MARKKEVDLRMINHDFLRDFIRMWRERPVLWDKKHEKYLNDGARFPAYVDLHEKWMEVDKNATIETVKNKIQGMRSVFRRELRRLETGEKSGKEYIIKLWYFPELIFLTDKEIPKSVLDKINSENAEDLKLDVLYLNTVSNNALRTEESVKKFISFYRTYECLWNMKSTNYYNRTVKIRALENIRKKLAETEEHLSIEMIKVKINSLRTSFLRELKKVKDARKKGAAYNPTLFYFNDLLFLIKDDLERWGFEALPDSTSDFKEFENINFKNFCKTSTENNTKNQDSEQTDSDGNDTLANVRKKVKMQDDEVSIEFSYKSDDSWQPSNEFGNDDDEESDSQSKTASNLKNVSQKRKKLERKSKEVKQKLNPIEQITISSENILQKSKNKDDEVDTYAKYVACELRLLSDEDRTFVQKVFNDALFEAKVGNAKCMRLISNTRLQLKLKKND